MINPHRLPRTVIPSNYRLTLEPDLAAASFMGEVEISADIRNATSTITLNSIELDITALTITDRSSGAVMESTFSLDDELQRLNIRCDNELAPGPISIVAEFTGVLNDQLRGFYRSTYTDDDGAEFTIATTQFQSTDARRAFPCFDEPDFKATFDVTLIVDSDLLAISNSAEVASEPHRGHGGEPKISRTFATTMKMSTYLVAFVVGRLEQTDPIDVDGVPLTVVHRPGQSHLTQFALEAATASLRYFTDYYDISYPGDKIDLIAIPDFAFGAMENLGCITFREVLLLIDPREGTQPELQNVADVVAHELAHMWFGDLVTMAWWEGIWLNEAFATFMEMKATDNFKPEWDRWTNFGLSRTSAFDVDSLIATRAIEFPVESPADAEAMFDVLTYEKGAAVVRMLEQFLGEATFRNGIRAYLEAHSYGNTETSDLWDALETASGEGVREIMKTWIYQGGYPVVSVDQRGELRQRRFSYGEVADDSTWAIPIGLRNLEREQKRVLLSSESVQCQLAPDEIVTLNHQGSGFYRSQLSIEHIERIGREGPGQLSAVERFGLIDDTWALTTAGEFEITTYLHLLDGFTEETNVSVWRRIAGSLATVDHLIGAERRPGFASLVARLLRPAFDALGPDAAETDSEEQRQRRAVLFGSLGTVGADGQLQHHAREIHASGATDPALSAAAINVIAASGDATEFDDFLARFRDPDSPQEMQRYLYALAEFDSAEQWARLAEMTLTEDVRSQNGPYVLQRLLQNRGAGPGAWQFITAHWDEVTDRFPSNSIARMLGGITALSTPELQAQVRSFLSEHEIPQGKATVEQHLERLAVNTRFRARLADSTIPS